ncbi:MAG TPA: DUF4421 family protein [Salinivirgaceae bacterium]|nr:DUF4421 family protein [Salinivirgaceae bacterium]
MRYCFIVLLIIVSKLAIGQSTASLFKANDIDTSYIEKDDRLVTNLLLLQKRVEFTVFNSENSQSLIFLPNGQSAIGFAGSYKWFGFGFSYKLPVDEKNLQFYGKTQSIDLQLNANLRRWIFDGYFQFYNGFYVSNINEISASYVPKSNLTVGNIGITANYIMNYTQFSYKAAFNFNEIQKKNRGSIIPGFYFFINFASHDSTIIPVEASTQFPDLINLKNIGSTQLGLSCGYGYNLNIRKKVHISLSLIPGIGISTLNAQTSENEPIPIKANATATLRSRISILYRNNAFYAGLLGISGTNTILGKSNYSISFGYGITCLVVGYNFDIKKFHTISEKSRSYRL